MTWKSDHVSVESSQPRELFRIVRSDGVTHYVASGSRDIAYGGQLFRATAMTRSSIGPSANGNGKEMELVMPIDHALVKRWTMQGLPPRQVVVTAWSMESGGDVRQIWAGEIIAMTWNEEIATFQVPSRMISMLMRVLPNISVGTTCPHVLYDENCGVSRTGASPGGVNHKVTGNVIHVNGRVVRIDLLSTDRNGTWAQGGEVVHLGSTERMTIQRQTDLNPGFSAVADLHMQAQIIGLSVGSVVEVYRGCPHTIAACDDDFDNHENFGGYPYLPTNNPFLVGEIA